MSTQTDTHTPGPWTIEEGDRETHIVGGEAILAYCPDWPSAQAEQEANARLIAAAPELLEAAESLLAVVGVRIDDPRIAQFDALRAAIAKAKGE